MQADCQSIIMSYTVPPSLEDLEVLCACVWQTIPEELSCNCEDLVIVVEDMADDIVQGDVGVEDPFDLVALYKSGKEIAPGIESKVSENEDILTIYRRSLLDMWCESEDDLQFLIRQVIIEELGRCFDFSDDEIQEMSDKSYL